MSNDRDIHGTGPLRPQFNRTLFYLGQAGAKQRHKISPKKRDKPSRNGRPFQRNYHSSAEIRRIRFKPPIFYGKSIDQF